MVKKYCPGCGRISFSACREDWYCPYCREDISRQPDYGINETVHLGGKNEAGEIGAGKDSRIITA